MALTHAQVFERRRQVSPLLIQGCTPAEVAEMLQVDLTTVYNDIRVVRSGRNPELSMKSVSEIFAQVLLNDGARRKALWREANGADSSTVRVFALREMRLQDAMILRHADRISRSVKPPDDPAKVKCDPSELTREEEKLISSLSIRCMTTHFEKPRASAEEIRQLKSLFERLEKEERKHHAEVEKKRGESQAAGFNPRVIEAPGFTPGEMQAPALKTGSDDKRMRLLRCARNDEDGARNDGLEGRCEERGDAAIAEGCKKFTNRPCGAERVTSNPPSGALPQRIGQQRVSSSPKNEEATQVGEERDENL